MEMSMLLSLKIEPASIQSTDKKKYLSFCLCLYVGFVCKRRGAAKLLMGVVNEVSKFGVHKLYTHGDEYASLSENRAGFHTEHIQTTISLLLSLSVCLVRV